MPTGTERPSSEPTARPDGVPPGGVPTDVDVLVVGGGPAGLSAATWLGRYRRRTLVVDAGEHRNRATEAVHGVPGRDPIAPAELRADALRDLARYPHVDLVDGRVTRVAGERDRFLADVAGSSVRASRVILATGVRDRFPALEGFDEHYGAGVQHCPTCEGFEARHRPVVVLGWGAHVPAFATELLDWASAVTVVTHGAGDRIAAGQRRGLAERGIELVDDRAEQLVGSRGQLRAVRCASGREIAAEMLFFSIGHDATVELATGLGCALTDEGVIAVDTEQETTVPGVYAAGDVTPGMQLVNVAVGEGTVAGVACAQSLQGHRTAPGAPPAAPAPEDLAPGAALGQP